NGRTPSHQQLDHHNNGAELQKKLIAEGKMPHAAQAGPEHRQPGEEDEAGNKIPHKGILSRILHGEHQSMNADR
ncbi:hypothetical protein LTR28_008935, partial [Elasticomyces elasticus]